MKKILFVLLLLSSISTFSQFKITGYFDAEIGLNYTFSEDFQAEIKVNDNLGIEFSTQLAILYKFISKEDYNLNVGIGISTFPFHSNKIKFIESFYLPLQIEITPFKEMRNFGLILESAYHFADKPDASGIRNSIGIRYIFN
jgi:hypothetical protein